MHRQPHDVFLGEVYGLAHCGQDNALHMVGGTPHLIRPGHVGGANPGDGHSVDRIVLVGLELIENLMHGVLANPILGVVLVNQPLAELGLLAAGGQGAGIHHPVHTTDPGRLKTVVHTQHIQLHGEVRGVVPASQQVGQVEDAVRLGGENRFDYVLELGDVAVHDAHLVFQSRERGGPGVDVHADDILAPLGQTVDCSRSDEPRATQD